MNIQQIYHMIRLGETYVGQIYNNIRKRSKYEKQFNE